MVLFRNGFWSLGAAGGSGSDKGGLNQQFLLTALSIPSYEIGREHGNSVSPWAGDQSTWGLFGAWVIAQIGERMPAKGLIMNWEARKHGERLAWITAKPLHTSWDLSSFHATPEQPNFQGGSPHQPLQGREHEVGGKETHAPLPCHQECPALYVSQAKSKQASDLSPYPTMLGQ